MATFSVVRALSTGRTLSVSPVSNVFSRQFNHSINVNQSICKYSRNFRTWDRVIFIPHRSLHAFSNHYELSSKYKFTSTSISLSISSKKHFLAKTYSSTSNSSGLHKEKDDGNNSSKTQEEEPEKEKKKESYWFGKNSWRIGLVFLGGALISWGIGLINIWGAPELDPDGNEIVDEFSHLPSALAYMRRTWKEMNIFKKKIQDPSREKLLPEPLTYPYMQPPYTLVLEMTGILLHPDWTYSTGWRFKKRPGIEYFLSQVGPPLFEVVLYSSEAGMTADPLVNHVDPQGYIMYRLYRDATRYMDGHHVKDLSCLNRDLSKVIMLDCNKDSVRLQQNNSLIMKKWSGEDGDRVLLDLAHFLKTIGTSGVEDVRPVLEYYSQFDDPLAAFRENQRKLQEDAEARLKLTAEENKKKSWLSSFKRS